MDFKQEIIDALRKETKLEEIHLEVPPNPELGDFAFPCFSLAKAYKKAPVQIAQDLASKIKIKSMSKIEAKGPYLNFFVNKENFTQDILTKMQKSENYGSLDLGKKKKILVEHTSINPNASPHVGRARNALIGDSIVRLLKFQGYDVETHYFVNDIGKQIAMLVLGAEGKKKVTFDDLLKIYVKINKQVEEKPELEKEVFQLLNRLEKGDKEIITKFRKMVEVCVKGQSEILSDLDIHYDVYDYESDYLWNKKTEEILKLLEKTGKLFTDEEGRKVLDQEGFDLAMKSPVLVLTRADGTSLYPLRDLAYHIDKKKDENIIVLGEDQKLYHQQIKAALSLIKFKAPRVVHYSFVLLQEGKMSTRKGTVVLLEDFMKEALDKSKKEIKQRHGEVKEEDAKKIAYGAIKYAILKVSNEKNVTFDWHQALNFEGDSGPYLQYAYARISSIFEKHGDKIKKDVDYSLLKEPQELELIKTLGTFPDIVKEAAEQLKPNLIANYLFHLASQFSVFYNACPVLKAEEDLMQARLVLIDSVRKVLKNGLSLLGIDVLDKM
ncbi:MAG TPA: arginine--tRNA ligase [Candidatus Nanoarchaeia archaeon]|nr:arginine--tRNA ligase [Candidatus Nanoarchaeia archaeon]